MTKTVMSPPDENGVCVYSKGGQVIAYQDTLPLEQPGRRRDAPMREEEKK